MKYICKNCGHKVTRQKIRQLTSVALLNRGGLGEMKKLTADKVKDGWIVKIIDTHHLSCESEVYKFAHQEGLRIDKSVSNDKWIFAE